VLHKPLITTLRRPYIRQRERARLMLIYMARCARVYGGRTSQPTVQRVITPTAMQEACSHSSNAKNKCGHASPTHRSPTTHRHVTRCQEVYSRRLLLPRRHTLRCYTPRYAATPPHDALRYATYAFFSYDVMALRVVDDATLRRRYMVLYATQEDMRVCWFIKSAAPRALH